jgi:drug/metabolite transporter (DMT)-like permease
MNSPQNFNRLAMFALFAITASWGASFVLMKDAIALVPVPDFLAVRFAIATAIIVLARPKVLRALTPRIWWTGGIAGLVLSAGYITQTIGLLYATPAITGFFTGLYVVATPLLSWLIFRQRMSWKVALAAAMAVTGLGIISLSTFGIGIGEILLIICAILFALHIVVLGKWSPGADPLALTLVQIIVVTVTATIMALTDGNGSGITVPNDATVWWAIIITAVFATAIGFFLQTWAQAHMDPSRAAILLTAEVPWAAIISVSTGHEVLTLRTIIGGSIMFLAMLVVEWPSRKRRAGEIVPTHAPGHFE